MAAVPIESVHTEVIADRFNPQLLVHVTAADGARGTGEAWWGTYQPQSPPGAPVRPIASMIDDVLAPRCIGWDSEDPGGLWNALVRATIQYGAEGVVSSAISGVDIALWDLRARRHEVPVHHLLGPAAHTGIPAYASLTWLGDVGRVVEDAQRALAAGFRAVKLHEYDPDLILEVRHVLGPDVLLMVDASARLDEHGAHLAARRLAPAGLLWLEEPVYPQTDHAALAGLRRASTVPIAAGENEFSVAGLARLVAAGAVDVLQPEIAKFGGLTPAGDIGRLAEAAHVVLAPHNYSLGPSFLASLHWAVTERAAAWLEVPWLPAGQRFPSDLDVPALHDGCVPAPTAPGLSAPAR